MTTAKRAPGRLPISRHLLRMVLDLPKDLRIIGVVDVPGEDSVEILVKGPGVPDGARLSAVYAEVKPTQAKLDRLEVLDPDGKPERELFRLEGMAPGV